MIGSAGFLASLFATPAEERESCLVSRGVARVTRGVARGVGSVAL